MQEFKILTYNIHSGIGRDKVYRLDRIIEVLRKENPDIIALQEVDKNLRKSNRDDQSRIVADELRMDYFFCVNRITERGEYGISTFSRFPILNRQKYNLSYGSDIEPRGISRVDLEIDGGKLHIYNVHLGLGVRERKYQRRLMLSESILLDQAATDPKVVLGDFNDRVFSVVHGQLRNHFVDAFQYKKARHGATFRWGPLKMRLDHIYVSDNLQPVDSYVSRFPLVKMASDHRPLVAVIQVKNKTR